MRSPHWNVEFSSVSGIQRDLFLPFIDLVEELFTVHSLDASPTDYRLLKSADVAEDTYFVEEFPDSPENSASAGSLDSARGRYERLYKRLVNDGEVVPVTLRTQGRDVLVNRAVIGRRIARFDFEELCGRPLGAADYIAIADTFPTVFLENVPRLSLNEVNRVRRLITLVDTLYESGVKLICLSSAAPTELFTSATDTTTTSTPQAPRKESHDEVFAFDRTVSRLLEMQSKAYLKQQTNHSLSGTQLLGSLTLEQELIDGETLKRVWEAYDVDQDGTIDLNELAALMEDLMELSRGHRDVPREFVKAIFKDMDVDSNGQVDYEELHSYFTNRGLLSWTIGIRDR